MNEPGASDLERMRDESIDTGQPVARFAASGERIRAGEVYVVAPDGTPNLDRLQEYLFIQPDHLWRASWLPDRGTRFQRADVARRFVTFADVWPRQWAPSPRTWRPGRRSYGQGRRRGRARRSAATTTRSRCSWPT
jgi:hypothetical protein